MNLAAELASLKRGTELLKNNAPEQPANYQPKPMPLVPAPTTPAPTGTEAPEYDFERMKGLIDFGTGEIGKVTQGTRVSQVTAPTIQAVTREVDRDTETVQGQLEGLLDKQNPLMRQAYQRGVRQANARGLINSTMAGESAQNALMQQAIPIASADANIYGTQGRYNQQLMQETAVRNAEMQFQASQQNAQAQNTVNQEGMRAQVNFIGQVLGNEMAIDFERVRQDNSLALQQSVNANNILNQYAADITNIRTSSMSAEQQAAAIRERTQILNGQLAFTTGAQVEMDALGFPPPPTTAPTTQPPPPSVGKPSSFLGIIR